jgi:uncharacterized membrane protein YkvI
VAEELLDTLEQVVLERIMPTAVLHTLHQVMVLVEAVVVEEETLTAMVLAVVVVELVSTVKDLTVQVFLTDQSLTVVAVDRAEALVEAHQLPQWIQQVLVVSMVVAVVVLTKTMQVVSEREARFALSGDQIETSHQLT